MADERLLRALAEQLKLPLLQIARQAELSSTGQNADLQSITSIAEMSLRLIDGFLLTTNQGQEALKLEPVSVSSLLYDTAEMLRPLASQYECELDVNLSGKYGPVMANEKSLRTAFMLLGYSLIETRTNESTRHQLVLAAHSSARGLVAGLFDNQPGLTNDMLRRGRALYGHARQALPSISANAGAGIFVADTLLKSMAAPLHLARHNSLTGMATTLVPSKQLQLI